MSESPAAWIPELHAWCQTSDEGDELRSQKDPTTLPLLNATHLGRHAYGLLSHVPFVTTAPASLRPEPSSNVTAGGGCGVGPGEGGGGAWSGGGGGGAKLSGPLPPHLFPMQRRKFLTPLPQAPVAALLSPPHGLSPPRALVQAQAPSPTGSPGPEAEPGLAPGLPWRRLAAGGGAGGCPKAPEERSPLRVCEACLGGPDLSAWLGTRNSAMWPC